MAKKKLTARQRDIERLSKTYQANISALTPEYESVLGKKTEALSGYEAQSADFQKRLQDYQKSLAEYKANPFEPQKIKGSFRYQSLKKAGSADPYEWGYAIDGNWYSAKNLPQGYVEEKESGEYALKKKAMPTFQDAAPQVADTTQYDTELAAVESKRKTLGEEFQRETSERKSARLAAVGRRERSRPMLSKGASLNG